MPQLLLVNPRKRTKKMAKRRTAKQRAATKKLVRFNKARGSLNKKRAPARRKNPAKRRAVSRKASAPKKRRSVARMSNPKRRRVVRKRSGMVMRILPGSAMAAGGALGLDVLMGYVSPFLPAALTANPAYTPLVKASMAIGAGMLLKQFKILTSKNIEQFVGGSLTVNLYQVGQQLIQQNLPAVPMAGYPGDSLGWYSPGMVAEGGDVNGMNPMGAYDMNTMGTYSPDAQAPY